MIVTVPAQPEYPRRRARVEAASTSRPRATIDQSATRRVQTRPHGRDGIQATRPARSRRGATEPGFA